MITLLDAIKKSNEIADNWKLEEPVAITEIHDCEQCWFINYDYKTPFSKREYPYPYPAGGPGLYVAIKKADGSDMTMEVYYDEEFDFGPEIEPPEEYRVPWYGTEDYEFRF